MNYICSICGETYHDEWILVAHQELFHNGATERDSVIHYAPASKRSRSNEDSLPSNSVDDCRSVDHEIIAQAFVGRVCIHYRISNTNSLDLERFLTNAKRVVLNILHKELLRLNFIKFGIVLDSKFTNVEDKVTFRGFITKNRIIMQSSDSEKQVQECFDELIAKITEHQLRGSGWKLSDVLGIDLRIHKNGLGDRGSSYLELPNKILNTKSCVNVKNTDSHCFKYALTCKYLSAEDTPYRPSNKYNALFAKYNFECISYPVSLLDIKTFERHNRGVSVNVFGLDDSQNVFPLKVVEHELTDHTDLLLIKKGDISHYVYIKNFNRLMSNQLTKNRKSITACKRCLGYICKEYARGGRTWLVEHSRVCGKFPPVRTVYPKGENATVKFKSIIHQYRIPIVLYCDFESSLIPVREHEGPTSSRSKYQSHEPNSYCILLKSTLDENHLNRFGLSTQRLLYRGPEAAKRFMDALYDIATKVEHLYHHRLPMKTMNDEELSRHECAATCYLCQSSFTTSNIKVRDHDHLTGVFRGSACQSCNLNLKLVSFIPVVFHNLSGYDSHFIIPELGRDKGSIDVLANTCERFISFSKKINGVKLRFVDSFRFMPSSLQTLSKNLDPIHLVESKKLVPDDDKLYMVSRKSVYPYDYIDSMARFDETSLPSREAFFSQLYQCDISEEDYEHACKVWNEMHMNTLGEYNDFYVSLDVTLLADVMEQFRNTCIEAYGLDPLHSYTTPGLAWQAMLKQTKCELQLLTDINMIHMVESGIRGGLCQVVKKHVKANNKYLPDYDPGKESLYLGYVDANNLYGWASQKPLPYGNFEWVDPNTIGDITLLDPEGEVGYILECDFQYPEALHDYHYDLPLLPVHSIPPGGKHKKLLTTLEDKTHYVAHYWLVQQAVELGLRLTKIHRALRFSQSTWLKPYIVSNTIRRSAATSLFEKDFYKLLNNAVFGKTLENSRLHKNVKLVSDRTKLMKLVAKPNFKTSVIINENLVAVCMEKTVVKMDKPLYIGFSILDISKTHMYDFHYNKMVSYYGRDRIGAIYTDTDSLAYWILTLDMYHDLRTFPHRDEFDFSDYPRDHPSYDNGVNKKVVGKFKDELNGDLLAEMVALMSKMYAMRILSREDHQINDIKKAKGVKSQCVKSNLTFEHYKKCLFENEIFRTTFNTIRSFNHKLFTVSETKIALSSHDDKRVTLADGVSTLPYGHYSLNEID